jgi:transmembrane sensor
MDDNRIAYLISRYFEGACTTAEREELADWISHVREDDTLRGVLEQAWQGYQPGDDIRLLATPALDRIQATLFTASGNETPIVPIGRQWKFWRPAAAAAVLFLIVAGLWTWSRQTSSHPVPAISVIHDARPGGNRAVLTLAGGGRILLDSAANGTLAEQGNTKVEKLATGQLAYKASSAKETSSVLYNTLYTPRGGQYQLTLPEGTRVWLNSASSITYPTAFTGAERKVSITGEVYFEVADDASHPFIVSKGAVDITVMGTHFNANTYDDEKDIKVSLLEGAVKVSRSGKGEILKPGQQAQVTDAVKVISNVDMAEVIAWKNGSFYFRRASLPVVLRQLSRWYDVDIVYEGPVPDLPFAGEMGKDLNLAQVLTILERMGVRTRIEGKKLIVMQ